MLPLLRDQEPPILFVCSIIDSLGKIEKALLADPNATARLVRCTSRNVYLAPASNALKSSALGAVTLSTRHHFSDGLHADRAFASAVLPT
jgi:hypothetical protein